VIGIHYRNDHYYADMLIATAIAWICHRIQLGKLWHVDLFDAAFGAIEIIFFMTSRDTLRKYYVRTKQLL